MGIGVVVLHDGQRKELGEYLGVGTNNIAELTAIERGLDLVAEMAKASGGQDARSRACGACASTATRATPSDCWRKAGRRRPTRSWSRASRKRVDAVPNLEFVKVPGHAGVPENERCDELARDAVLRGR